MTPMAKLRANVGGVFKVSGPTTGLHFLTAIATSIPHILRTKTLVAADRKMRHRSWPFTVQGERLVLEGRYFSGAREMFCRNVYFPSGEFLLKPGMTVVDLGCNAGLFSLLAAKKGCRVVAVEALRPFAKNAAELAAKNGVFITVENALIGSSIGMFSDREGIQRDPAFDGAFAPTITMPDLMRKHGLERINFLKCDIEGSEFALFRDCESWIKKVGVIAMEVHTDYGDPVSLLDQIRSQGFMAELRDDAMQRVSTITPPGGYLFAFNLSV